MTIALSDNTPRISYTVAEGVTQTAFTVTFEFFDNADLNFYVDGTLKTLTTHYTVTGGDGSTGTINTTAGNSVTGIAGGSTVVITRSIALERTTDFPSSGAFEVATLNTELDRFTAIAAEISDDNDRSIHLADDDATVSMTLPSKANRLGKVLGFNVTTGAVEAGPTIADVSSLSAITADISTLADIEDGTDATDAIQTVAGISGNVTTVAGISSNVTTVAGITANIAAVVADEADIGTVATNIASVNTVATNIADVITVANDLNEAVSELETVANDLNEATSEIDTVAGSISNVDTVGTNISNVNTVAGISANVTTVAGVSANVTTVAGISSNVTTVAGISSDVTAVAGDATDIGTVATNIANVNTVSGISGNVTTVAGISANVTTVAGISSDVSTVAGDSTAINAVANDATDIGLVAGSIANVNNVGGSIANVNTVATNISSVNNFADVYRIAASAPTTSLDLGDLYFDTTSDTLKVYGASGWQNAGSSINGTSQRYHYDITGTPTSVTGADANGNTLTYDAGYVDVYVNGVRMSTADVTVTSGDTVTFAEALADGDEVDIVGYGTFSVASLNADNLDSGTVPSARVSGAYTGITSVGTLTSFASTGIDDNSSSTAMTLDSSGNVGIGVVPETWTTSLSTRALQVGDVTSIHEVASQYSRFASNMYYDGTFKYITSNPATRYTQQGGTHVWDYASSGSADGAITFNEAMRIDSSGNLLVGKTSTAIEDVGLSILSTGRLIGTVDSDDVLVLRRNTSDGDIISFRKDTSTVGSIQSRSGIALTVNSQSGNGNLAYGGTNYVEWNNTRLGVATDNATDLGRASGRWKDLYLSGGVYLGGTGSANKLDDYEEGTFTPEVLNGWGVTSPTYSTNTGRYIKIGNLVHIQLKIVLSGGSINGNRLRIYQLPFGITSSATFTFGGFFNTASSNAENVILLAVENTSNLEFYYKTNTGVSQFTGSHAGSGFNFVFNGIFEVA